MCALSAEDITLNGTPFPSPSVTFVVGDTAASQVLTQFTEDSLYCDPSDIAYTMTVTPVLPSGGITFDSATLTVSWSTASYSDIGTYSIAVTGSLTNTFETATH